MAPRFPTFNRTKPIVLIFDPTKLPKVPNRRPKPLYPEYGPQEMPAFPLDQAFKKQIKSDPFVPDLKRRYALPRWVKPWHVGRMLPYVGWGIMALEAYNWWKPQAGSPVPAGWTQCFDEGGPYELSRTIVSPANAICGPAPCDYGLASGVNNQVANGPEYPAIAAVNPSPGTCTWQHVYTGPHYGGSIANRFHIRRKWSRIISTPQEAEQLAPQPDLPAVGIPPVDMPAWLPSLWPDAIPIGQPMPVPKPLPYRFLPRVNRPRPEPRPAIPPALQPGHVPAIDGNGKPDVHVRQKPEKNERERKKNLKGGHMAQWFNTALEKSINGITEGDEYASALYQALPWQVRRWKGRDGVWRDRDYLTADRLKRLYTHMGEVNMKKAVVGMMKKRAGDIAGLVIGKYANEALRQNKHYRGLLGIQDRRLNRTQWNLLYEQLRLAAAQQHKARDYYRWQMVDDLGRVVHWDQLEPKETFVETPRGYVRSYYYDTAPLEAQGFKWERNLIKGQKQQIPWLQSTYHKRITNPRRGSAAWWQANNEKRIALDQRRRYDHSAL